MSLKIRLTRGGAKRRPFYRVVVADSRSPRDGRFVEKIGTYNPMLPRGHADRLKLDTDRVRHWLGVGAQPTDRVALFLAQSGLAPMPARREQPIQSKPKAKAQERLKAAAEAAAAPAPPAEAPPAEAPPAEAPPAEAPPAEAPPAEAPPAE